MRIGRILFLFFFLLPALALGNGLDDYEAICKDIGFKPKTEKFGECVLELKKRNANKVMPSQEKKVDAPLGDGSEDDKTCQKYGFTPSSLHYGECRLKLSIAKKQFEAQQNQYESQLRQYDEEKRRYDEQLAAVQKERERQRSMKLLELGLRMAGGQAPVDAVNSTAGMMPLAPKQPQRPAFENYTITLPGNQSSYCSYDTTLQAMYCR